MVQNHAESETLSGFLEWISREYSARPALLYKPGLKTEVWTYEDLREQADRVTCWLQEQGIGKGDRVVIWAPNSPWWVATFFGILRNGSIVVPLDARSSPDFAERVVRQSEPQLAIATAASRTSWAFDVPVFDIADLDRTLPRRAPPSFPEISPDDLAQVIFTSGTTGAPKGVMLSHRNLRSNVEAANLVFPSGPRFRPLSILPLSHLFEQVVGLMLPLRGGTSIAYASALQPAAILRDMAEYRVTTMLLVPRILSMFMDAIERRVKSEGKEQIWNVMCRVADYLPRRARRLLFRDVIQSFGGRLDFLVAGGAALEPELEHKWERMGIAILQGYGSTETSPITTATALDDRRPRSVGKAIPGSAVTVTKEGEIRVEGPNVMQGYWRNPEATAEVLKDGYYYTGDLGDLDSEGRLYLKGRKKNMIVLANGLNVFPEDVEEALRRAPGVNEAVVMAVPSDFGPQIHAVLLCDTPDADTAAAVKQANASLAPHQHIRSFETWPDEDFPRTHTAKIKRPEVAKRVLAEQRGDRVAVEQAPRASRKPTLTDVMAQRLGMPAAELTPDLRLEDVGVGAAELFALERAVEDRLGKFLDDARVGPDTTVGDLEGFLSSENPSGEHLYPLWPFSREIRTLRAFLQLPIFWAIKRYARPRIVGRGRLHSLRFPAVFVLDYDHPLDAPFALYAFPGAVRGRVGISTSWKADRGNRVIAGLEEFFFNSFRYSPSGSLHATLVHASGLLDHGWSILLLLRAGTTESKARSISRAVGLLGTEFGAPIVPMRITGLGGAILPLPRSGAVTITFGESLAFEAGMSLDDIETALWSAMHELSGGAAGGDPRRRAEIPAESKR